MNWEIFKDGINIAAAGYLIVFVALSIIFIAFYFLPKIIKIRIKKVLVKSNKHEIAHKVNEELTGATVAAISVAIHNYLNEHHDKESYDLTIKRIKKTYSPWNSKIYAMNNINKMR